MFCQTHLLLGFRIRLEPLQLLFGLLDLFKKLAFSLIVSVAHLLQFSAGIVMTGSEIGELLSRFFETPRHAVSYFGQSIVVLLQCLVHSRSALAHSDRVSGHSP